MLIESLTSCIILTIPFQGFHNSQIILSKEMILIKDARVGWC
jgi:hypothetical protein